MMKRRRPRLEQEQLPFRNRGGYRENAGRPPGERPWVPRGKRAALASRFPVHVWIRLRDGLRSMRRKAEYRVLRRAFAAGCERFGFRLVHYSVPGNHLHFIVEAKDRRALSRGMQGLLVRVAKALNKLWGRKGSVFADRYAEHILKTPREVRNAVAYVVHNARRHGARLESLDTYSSAAWFDGWKERITVRGLEGVTCPVASGRTWLLTTGWKRHRLISAFETPGHRR